MRSDLELAIVQERAPLYVQISDGGIRNAYDLRILNKSGATRTLEIGLAGAPDAELRLLDGKDGVSALRLEPGEYVVDKLFVTFPKGSAPSEDLSITLSEQGEEIRKHKLVFAVPD